ncbi:hypothetical protein [Actinomadura sp. 6N118]|uniref:hypothetical protein n=1 Tax=Actinomadura sp. 6N118 TaxID=3375151 RepID=UPI00379B956E
MRNFTRTALAAAAVCTAFTFTPSAAATPSPSASEKAAATSQQGKNCLVVLDRVKPGEKASRVVSRTCADDKADLRINEQTVLMYWNGDSDFGGAFTAVAGWYGPCDDTGYVLELDSWWRRNISSFETRASCDRQQAVANDGRTTRYYSGYTTAYVGDRMNDDIGWFKIWRSF